MIYKSIFSSALGYIEICADTEQAVTRVYFTSSPSDSFTPNPVTEQAAREIEQYFNGTRQTFDVPIAPEGTAFEKEVWEACRKIAYGESKTAKEIAEAIGDDKAARKVTLAVEKNPLALLVPTHRVKKKSSFLTAVSAACAMDEALLGAEKTFLKKKK